MTSSGNTTKLIPRDLLFGNPEKTQARLSPDGTQLSYLAPSGGVLNVWVGPVDQPEAAEPVTNDTERGIRNYAWAYTGDAVLYQQDKGGDENWHVYRVNLASGDTQDLTPVEGVNAQIQKLSPKLPNEVLVGLNARNPEVFDLYRINIGSGERTLVYENTDNLIGYMTDDDYQLHLGNRATADGESEILQRTEEGWELLITASLEDSLTTQPIGLDKSGTYVYMMDSRGRDTAAAVKVNLATGESDMLFVDPRADVSDALIHPTEKTLQAVASEYERVSWTVLDESIASDLEYLRTVTGGDLSVVSRTLDDRTWLVAYTLADGPTTYYLYDRNAGEATFLFTDRPALEDAPLAQMHPVVIRARDGLELVSYLTLPVGTSKDGDTRPDAPLPLVLFVHGGPWARDRRGFQPYHQWLANRGYAVLSVNFRGSTGFGKGFINAGNLEWGGAMQHDLTDAVHWAISEGIAQRDKVAIMGGSYGGYATLAGLTFTPEVYAAGVDIVGPSNLMTLVESVPPYWKPLLSTFSKRMGDPSTEAGKALLIERSPLTHAGNIVSPLLIAQGANDPRVKRAESDQIVAALQEKEIPVTYVLYPDEGHGFARPANTLSFTAVAEAFLAEHLGGRAEPIGDDFEGSSLEVLTGAEQIPNLTEALETK